MIDINVFVLVNILRLGVNKSPIQMTNDANTLESKLHKSVCEITPPNKKLKKTHPSQYAVYSLQTETFKV